MRVIHGLSLFFLIGLLPGAALPAAAQDTTSVTTAKPASILIFPRVISDSSRDTTIQVANSSNSVVYASCFYVSYEPAMPDQPVGPDNPPVFSSTSFALFLIRQQPTHWVTSRGRAVDPGDPQCSPAEASCDGAGSDPGTIPPMATAFHGELLCVETNAIGSALPGNHLSGVATLVDRSTGDISQYNAMGIPGNADLSGGDNNVLCIGGGVSQDCPSGPVYLPCPQRWWVDYVPEGAPDPLAGAGSSVENTLSVVTCAHDLEGGTATSGVLQILLYDELERRYSTSAALTSPQTFDFASRALDGLSWAFVQTPYAHYSVSSTGGGIAVVAEETRRGVGSGSSAADFIPATHEGPGATGDLIRLPLQ